MRRRVQWITLALGPLWLVSCSRNPPAPEASRSGSLGAKERPRGAAVAEEPSRRSPTRAAAAIVEVAPRRIKGAWTRADWRRPHAFCRDLAAYAPEPAGDWSTNRRWQESCGDLPGPPAEITLRGTGFATPPSDNTVFVGGSRAEVVAGDDTHLVVRLPSSVTHGGHVDVVVHTTPTASDDPHALGRSELKRAVLILGPPRRVLVAEGDGQSATVASALRPILFRVVDAQGEGVPDERVWVWLRSLGGRWPEKPVFSEARTDALGFVRQSLTLPLVSSTFGIQAEAVNAAAEGRPPLAVARATALPSSADLDAILDDLQRGDPAKRSAATRALVELGPTAAAPAVATLTELARSADADLSRAAVDALATLKPAAALPHYVAALRLDSLHDRMWAASGLARMGPAASDAVPALVAVLSLDRGGRDYGPRVEAMGALSNIGGAAGAAVPALVATLADRDPQLRRDAARLLGRIGSPAAKNAETALRKAARDDERPDVREAASAALERSFGGVAPKTLAAVEVGGQGHSARTRIELRARLTDREGRGLANERVTFEVAAGAAALYPTSALTDANGTASVGLLLGEAPGTVRVEARHDGQAVSFRVSVVR